MAVAIAVGRFSVCVAAFCLLCASALLERDTYSQPALPHSSAIVELSSTAVWIWRCVSWHNGMALSNGSSLLIARRSVDEFDVLSSEDLQASNCTKLVDYSELVAMEVKENWESLEQHLDPMYKLQFFNSSFSKNNKVKRNQALVDNADQWFSQYHNITEIQEWFRRLSEENQLTVFMNNSIGKSSQYNIDIFSVHITDKSVRKEKTKIYLQCLLHAREWISGSVCMYLAQQLAQPERSNDALIDLLKEVEFIFVPLANPDGYYLTWYKYPKYRMWRKNLAGAGVGKCAGVDLNRNFDVHWSEDGGGADPCSDLYQGTSAGSEREVQTIADYIKHHSPVHGAIDFHSYYQEVLYPYAWTADSPQDEEDLKRIADSVASAIGAVNGQVYSTQRMGSVYVASGTFVDWIYVYSQEREERDGCGSVPLTIELRPTHSQKKIYLGFMLPVDQILPTCKEMSAALLRFATLIVERASSNHCV